MSTTSNNATQTSDISTDPKVLDAIREVRDALLGASKEDIASKYFAGQAVERIRKTASNEKYGKKAVSIIAREVGVSAARLYQCADVARTWSEPVFSRVGLAAAKAGLTFSHFVELAHHDHSAERSDRLNAAIDRKLSVRQLRALRTEKTAAPSGAKLVTRAPEPAPENVDVLARIESEGMTHDTLEALDAELHALCNQRVGLQARIEKLEEVRAQWVWSEPDKSEDPNSVKHIEESGSDLGKAAE